jgi:hypothetical protein
MCNITQGITPAGCVQSLPGVQPTKIWVANYSDIDSFTAGSTDASWQGITMNASAYLYKFDVFKNSVSFTEELQSADTSGDYYQQTVSFRVVDDSLDTVLATRGMLGSELVFVMQKRNGKFYLLGDLEGLKLGEGTMHESGAAPGDDAGRMFSFTGIVQNQAKQFLVTDEASTISYLDALVQAS